MKACVCKPLQDETPALRVERQLITDSQPEFPAHRHWDHKAPIGAEHDGDAHADSLPAVSRSGVHLH